MAIAQVEEEENDDMPKSGFWNRYELFDFPANNYSKYILSPSAHMLKAGDMVYTNTYLIYNSLGLGITNNVTIAASADLLLLAGDSRYGTGTVKIRVGDEVLNNLHIAGGVYFIKTPFGDLPDLDEPATFSGALLTITMGDRDINASLHYGLITNLDRFQPTSYVGFSGLLRFSNRLALFTDNSLIQLNLPVDLSFASFAARYYTLNGSIDIGIIDPSIYTHGEDFPVIPYISISKHLF